MPAYEIEHTTPLSPSEKDQLAQAITDIHTRLFTTPSLFVNVRFVKVGDGGEEGEGGYYVGGRKTSVNRILAHVRPGGDRSTAMFNQLTNDINAAWREIILRPHFPGKANGEGGGDKQQLQQQQQRELRAVFILGTIIAGSEAGFMLPPAGGDRQWLRDNADAFRAKAEKGDVDFQQLMREMETREDLRGILG
ncbi:hypothetical protein ACLMJK_008870 [Lecanora helva]